MLLKDAVQVYLRENSHIRQWSSNSTRSYRNRLLSLVRFAEAHGIYSLESVLTEEVFVNYCEYLSCQRLAQKTVYALKQGLCSFWSWAHSKGWVPSRPSFRLRKPAEPPVTYLTSEEAARLEIAARYGTTPTSILHFRDQASFRVLCELEIDIESLVRLRVDDFDPIEGVLKLNCLFMKLSPTLRQSLAECLVARQAVNLQSPYLFPTRTGKRWRLAGVRKAIDRHRQASGLAPLGKGQPAHPRKWPPQEREIFLSTPVAPYDSSVEQGQLIVSLGLRCGLRRGEMLALRSKDVDLERRKLRVVGKGEKGREIPLDSYMVKLLRPVLQTRIPDQHLLLNHRGLPLSSPRRVNDIVSCLAARAGIVGKKVTPHTLRHTYATHLAETVGVSLPIMQQLLGHTRIEETLRYVHIDESRLREGVERLGQLYASTEEQIISEWVKGELCSR